MHFFSCRHRPVNILSQRWFEKPILILGASSLSQYVEYHISVGHDSAKARKARTMTQVPGIGTRRLSQVESASSSTSFMVGKKSEEKLGGTRGKGSLKRETTLELRKKSFSFDFLSITAHTRTPSFSLILYIWPLILETSWLSLRQQQISAELWQIQMAS